MRPQFNFMSTASIFAKTAKKKPRDSKVKPRKPESKKKKDMNNTQMLSQSVLNFAKAAFVIVLTVVFIVLACLGKVDTDFYNTLVGSFSPFL
ncbi:hypothetical protein ELQ35_00865 [Peribacillus cavernae]|uniref:Uncharacterized protein n=1 Tax=Peribacillus cavernae TaxID=1674310 RepID=A0A433HWL4_9BACI|nr:hypothetical protein [Peribacillus cavernae]MDQ0218179.1 hypothetical protein [Peribacillus cavernae]RUQ32675.1 hypothetical protein ELQ35_00865 [Peribacillus cavernae]